MPNRILRDWTASEIIDSLSIDAEIFFTRLIMKVDDFGCFHGNPKLLKSALFPLREIKDQKINSVINELQTKNIIVYYQVDGKKYLKINDFRQRLRKMKSNFPQPEDDCQAIDGQSAVNCQPETETETETETEEEEETETETNVLLCSLSLKDELSDKIELITFSFYTLFKQNLIDAGAKSTSTIDKARMNDWKVHISRMISIDKRTHVELITIFHFLKTNEFWKKNIQSTKKLREQFEKLMLNAKKQINSSTIDPEHIQSLKERLS